jgi:hypothetical protein
LLGLPRSPIPHLPCSTSVPLLHKSHLSRRAKLLFGIRSLPPPTSHVYTIVGAAHPVPCWPYTCASHMPYCRTPVGCRCGRITSPLGQKATRQLHRPTRSPLHASLPASTTRLRLVCSAHPPLVPAPVPLHTARHVVDQALPTTCPVRP